MVGFGLLSVVGFRCCGLMFFVSWLVLLFLLWLIVGVACRYELFVVVVVDIVVCS